MRNYDYNLLKLRPQIQSSESIVDNKDFLNRVVELLLTTGSLLVSIGCSSNRVELLLGQLGTHFKVKTDILALPTGITLVARFEQQRITEMIRIRKWSVDLNKLDRINQLILNISQKQLTLENASSQMNQLRESPPPYHFILSYFSQSGMSFGLIYFYGGTWLECLTGFVISMVVGVVLHFAQTSENRRYLADFVGSAVVAILSSLASDFFPQIDSHKVAVGAIVVMLPGLVLVNSFHELAQKNLVSGAAKTFEAGMIGLSLWFGAMFGFGILQFLQRFYY